MATFKLEMDKRSTQNRKKPAIIDEEQRGKEPAPVSLSRGTRENPNLSLSPSLLHALRRCLQGEQKDKSFQRTWEHTANLDTFSWGSWLTYSTGILGHDAFTTVKSYHPLRKESTRKHTAVMLLLTLHLICSSVLMVTVRMWDWEIKIVFTRNTRASI